MESRTTMASESKPEDTWESQDARVVSNTMVAYWQRRDNKCYALEAEVKKLREALVGYHNLAPALAEIVNESGEALLYSDLHTANQKAEEVLGA